MIQVKDITLKMGGIEYKLKAGTVTGKVSSSRVELGGEVESVRGTLTGRTSSGPYSYDNLATAEELRDGGFNVEAEIMEAIVNAKKEEAMRDPIPGWTQEELFDLAQAGGGVMDFKINGVDYKLKAEVTNTGKRLLTVDEKEFRTVFGLDPEPPPKPTIKTPVSGVYTTKSNGVTQVHVPVSLHGCGFLQIIIDGEDKGIILEGTPDPFTEMSVGYSPAMEGELPDLKPDSQAAKQIASVELLTKKLAIVTALLGSEMIIDEDGDAEFTVDFNKLPDGVECIMVGPKLREED